MWMNTPPKRRKIEEIRDIAYRVRRTGKAYLTDAYSPRPKDYPEVIQEMEGVTSESEGNSLIKGVD